MVLIRNKPLPNDILSDSQVDLYNNNNAIDDSFGSDHYPSSNLTANNGKHQVVTTPDQVAHPVTATDPRFYAVSDNATIGPLQYTKGPNQAIQTPLTCLQSPSAGISIAPSQPSAILDFSGLPLCYGLVYVTYRLATISTILVIYDFMWNGTQGSLPQLVTGVGATISVIFSGNILQIRNGLLAIDKVAWTLEFRRILTPT